MSGGVCRCLAGWLGGVRDESLPLLAPIQDQGSWWEGGELTGALGPAPSWTHDSSRAITAGGIRGDSRTGICGIWLSSTGGVGLCWAEDDCVNELIGSLDLVKCGKSFFQLKNLLSKRDAVHTTGCESEWSHGKKMRWCRQKINKRRPVQRLKEQKQKLTAQGSQVAATGMEGSGTHIQGR